MTPEQKARIQIDNLLEQAGWAVQDAGSVNLSAARGVAVREFGLKPGHGTADYLLYVDGKAAGVISEVKAGAGADLASRRPPGSRAARRVQRTGEVAAPGPRAPCRRRPDVAGHSRTFDEETDPRSVALVNGPRLKLSVMKIGGDHRDHGRRLTRSSRPRTLLPCSGDPRSGVPSAGLLVSSDTRPLPLRNGRPEEQ